MQRHKAKRLSGWHRNARAGRCTHRKLGGPCDHCRKVQEDRVRFMKAEHKLIGEQLITRRKYG